jgi:hypothetical protein
VTGDGTRATPILSPRACILQHPTHWSGVVTHMAFARARMRAIDRDADARESLLIP